MLKIWGRATSSNVQLAMWAINELGLEHERVDAGGSFGVVDTPEYRRMNPNGLVPVLQDGDLTMFESAAIVRYLGAQYGGEDFWPRDARRRAALDVWAEWAKITFTPLIIHRLFIPLIRQKPEQRDKAALETAVRELAKLAKIADDRLAGGGLLGGETVSFADIMLGGPLYRYFTLDFERARTPHLEAYYQLLTERPAYAQHVMISYESLRAK
jgi:glutathione S-transferase